MKIKELFSFLNPRNNERESVKETESVSGESTNVKENDFMENENKTIEETKKVVDDEQLEKGAVEEKKEDVENKSEADNTDQKEEEQTEAVEPSVQSTTETGNGIDINDVATKDFVKEQLSAFSAKYEALLKENEDLKAKLAESNDKVQNMQSKYEGNDFGNFANRGVQVKNKVANESFEEYSKQFM